MDVIYCAGNNKKLMQIAHSAGFLLGVRSGCTPSGFPIAFVDSDYKHPDFRLHLATVERLRPTYSIVSDLSDTEVCDRDIARALEQAIHLARYCQIPLLVPKLSAQLACIPPQWAVAYSIPTTYGGARYPIADVHTRRIHLLGGSPHAQMKLYRDAPDAIQSVDGNMAQLMAIKFAKYWHNNRWVMHQRRGQGIPDLYLECWKHSCDNILSAWGKLT